MGSLLLDILPYTDGNYYFFKHDEYFDEGLYVKNYPEAFLYAGIGILVVFLGILILIGILYLVGFIFKKLEQKGILNRKNKKSKEKAELAEPVAETIPLQEETVSDDIPDEVKAAIIAAIMAYYQTEQPKCEFTVKRIKRI